MSRSSSPTLPRNRLPAQLGSLFYDPDTLVSFAEASNLQIRTSHSFAAVSFHWLDVHMPSDQAIRGTSPSYLLHPTTYQLPFI
jgi:hypothetical protein